VELFDLECLQEDDLLKLVHRLISRATADREIY